MLSSESLPLNARIIWSDPISGRFPSYVACVCNHCRRTNQNRCSMMGMTINISCVYNAFSAYRVYFSLMTSLTIMVLGPVHLLRALFHFPLAILLVVSVAQDLKWWNSIFHFFMVKWGKLVESHKYFPKLVESHKYFPGLVESQKHFPKLVES